MPGLLTPRRASTLLLVCALVVLATASGERSSLTPFGAVLRAQSGGPPPGLYELVAMHSGKCLDVDHALQDDFTRIIQYTCHGGENQHWRVEPTGDGYYRLLANHSGKALDVDHLSL